MAGMMGDMILAHCLDEPAAAIGRQAPTGEQRGVKQACIRTFDQMTQPGLCAINSERDITVTDDLSVCTVQVPFIANAGSAFA